MELSFKTFFNVKVLVALLVLGLLLFLDLHVKKDMQEKEVKQFVIQILEHWKAGDPTTSMKKWEDPSLYPPIEQVVSYDIKRVIFLKDRLEGTQAKFLVQLDFVPGAFLPTGKKWIFELKKKSFSWKVHHFGLAE